MEAELGRLAEKPMIEFTIPSLADKTLAPPNFFVASIFAQYYPYGQSISKDQVFDNLMRNMEQYAPGFKDSVVHYEVLRPQDLED